MSSTVGSPATPPVRESSLGTLRTLVVEPPGGRSTMAVALRGATLLSWRVRAAEHSVELIDGYASEDEFSREDGMRSAVMAPYSNRIAGSRYTFGGHEISFHTGSPAEETPDVMHGLLREQDFEVAEVVHGDATTSVELVSRVLRPGVFDGYPFAVDVSVRYTISPDTIEIVVTGTNVGVDAAPYSSGWHPYFRLGSTPLAEMELRVPARTRIVVREDLIPLDDSAAFQSMTGAHDPFDFRVARPIGQFAIDVCFVELETGTDGLIHTTLEDPVQALALDIWQERGAVHVYTGEALEREPRCSIAIEPVEALTNAANRPDQADRIRLEGGASRSFRFGVTARTH